MIKMAMIRGWFSVEFNSTVTVPCRDGTPVQNILHSIISASYLGQKTF
jgi:hypothetical protein